jgi:hypothetical protein
MQSRLNGFHEENKNNIQCIYSVYTSKQYQARLEEILMALNFSEHIEDMLL